jgi:hypothetical protein
VLYKKETSKDTSSLFGSALHNAIEYYYTKGYDPIARFNRYIQIMYHRYSRYYDLTRSISYNDMFKVGKEILTTFPFNDYTPLYTEYDFTVPLIHPFTKSHIANLHGFMDMVCADSIIDFKSSKRKPTQSALNEDPQFILYYYAYYQLFGVYPAHVYWHNLRDHSILEFQPKDIDRKMSAICSTVFAIELDHFDGVKNNERICQRCAPWCGRKDM